MAAIEERVRAALTRLTDEPIVEKRMFQGQGFMWRGRLLVSTHRQDGELVLPLGKDADPGPGLRPMVMGSRESKGWFFVAADAIADDADLDAQLRRALDYIGSLPRR